jgi:hypothetical protein
MSGFMGVEGGGKKRASERAEGNASAVASGREGWPRATRLILTLDHPFRKVPGGGTGQTRTHRPDGSNGHGKSIYIPQIL